MGDYVYPRLGRSGLGNLLWTWAKSYVWAAEHDAEILAPQWGYVDWRRCLHRDPDQRRYHSFFTNQGYIQGIRRTHLLLTLPKVDPEQYASCHKSCVVVFGGLGTFTPLIGKHTLVANEFLRIINPVNFPAGRAYPEKYLALHVRLGDFKTANPEKLRQGSTNMRQPLEWYLYALRECRKCIGYEIPTVVFSDGSAEELDQLLNESNVQMSGGQSAMADLIALSRSAILIGSRSSFSLWAAYIGQMPVIYYKGARPWHEPTVHPDENEPWEIEWMPGDNFSESFTRLLKQCVPS